MKFVFYYNYVEVLLSCVMVLFYEVLTNPLAKFVVLFAPGLWAYYGFNFRLVSVCNICICRYVCLYKKNIQLYNSAVTYNTSILVVCALLVSQ